MGGEGRKEEKNSTGNIRKETTIEGRIGIKGQRE